VSSAQLAPPPKHLGRFEVGAKIGGGGMATVYLGRTERDDGTEQVVALKVIRDEFVNDPQFSGMFIDEAKILARLKHPNVIRTLEYGITGKHRYIAMELLSGRTYADVWDLLVHQGRFMPIELGAWICARVADGLHCAHELVDAKGAPLNVIHRDVNPSNVFLTHGGEVKLIDFGLAKARMRIARSADGIVKGKIPYLAPEQAQGKAIDRRTDVYALGATLWETATMKRLFKRDTDIDTLRAIRDAHVPDVRELVEGFPEALWNIIDKALKPDPDARYATARDMQRALDAFVSDSVAMKKELADLVSELFPGQEQKHDAWARAATNVRVPKHTMPPPAPVPIASSTLLEDVESAPDLDGERGRNSTISSRPDVLEVLARETDDDDAREEPAPRSKRAPHDDIVMRAHDAHGPTRLWVSLAVVLLVCALIAAIVASR
jgi:eukaryotic-like serine/threonine-protein kinase